MLVAPPRRTVQLAATALLAFAVFAPALTGEFVSDDAGLVQASSHSLRDAATRRFWNDDAGVSSLYRNAYRPVSQLALALAVRVFHGDAAGLHLVNLLLHVAISALVLRWLTRRLRWQTWATPAHELSWAALTGAVLFAVHPVHAESVAWISGATDLWMTLALLLGFELLEHTRGLARITASCCFAAAALAKEPALLAPLLCWVDASASAADSRERRTRTLWCCLGVAMAIGAIGVTLAADDAHRPAAISFGKPHEMLAALGFYTRMLLAPTSLTFQAPPYRRVGNGLELPVWSSLLGALMCALGVWFSVRWLRSSRAATQGPSDQLARACSADLLWILAPLLPALVLQPQLLSDRFLYAPSLGVVALAARGLSSAWRSTRTDTRRWAALLPLPVIIACIVRSAQAAACFENDVTLWSSQIAAHPDHFKAIDALAEDRLHLGQHHRARELFERGLVRAHAVRQRGWMLHSLAHLALLEATGRPAWDPRQYNGRAHCDELLGAGRLAYTHNSLQIATRVTPRELNQWLIDDPAFLLLPCARILLATQEPARASVLARRALAVTPGDLAARELLALALARAGDFDAAHAALQAPGSNRVHPALAPLQQRIRTAHALLDKAGDDPYANALTRAQVALILGDSPAARAALSPALRDPTDHAAVHMLAQTYVTEGRFELAEATVEKAARLAPADPYWASALESLAEARSAGAPLHPH